MTPIFLIAGPPAAGKSSTARALAQHHLKAIHIPVDTIREFVVAGLVLPGGDWNEALVEQLRLARSSVVTMAFAYRQAGFVVVIDDFLDPVSRMSEYEELIAAPEVHRIALLPPIATAQNRNLARSGGEIADGYIALGIEAAYSALLPTVGSLRDEGWIVIDNGALTIDRTVDRIRSSIARRTDVP